MRIVIIYVDGFMKSKKEHIGGCKLRVEVDGKFIKEEPYTSYFDRIVVDWWRNYIMNVCPQTNQVSEYYAMMLGVANAERYLRNMENIKVLIHSDSELVVSQLNGHWVCGAKHLLPFFNYCYAIYKEFEQRMHIQWVTRVKIVEVLGI